MSNLPNRNNTAAVIPFFNEAGTIENVVENVLHFIDTAILVNDGSKDNWNREIAGDKRVILIELPENMGKGNALNSGFRKSIEKNFKFTFTIDADLQHPPEKIPDFMNNMADCDICVGNRMADTGDMPLQRILSNKITSALLSIKTGVRFADSQCGFRLFRTAVLKDILPEADGFEAETEILINAAKKNISFSHVDIPAIYGNTSSKMKPLEAIAGFIKVLLTK